MLLAVALLSFTSLFGQYEVAKQCFQAPEKLSDVKLFYCDVDKSFAVQSRDNVHVIQKAFMDKELRSMDVRTLQKFLGAGYLSLQKMDNDEFSLKAKVRGLGGGLVGASVGAVAGGAIVQGAYGAATAGITVAATAVAGPIVAGSVVAIWGWATFAPLMFTTKAAMIAGGIAGGVATGPI